MKKYIAMVVLNPNLEKTQTDLVQAGIISLFEQKSKLLKTWFLGKRKLDYRIKKFTEGFYLKFEIETKEKKLEQIREILKQNRNVIFSFIINNDNESESLSILKKVKNPFKIEYISTPLQEYPQNNKVYMLISKNLKLPFSESNILAISNNKNSIFQVANKKLQEYVYIKGFHTIKELKNLKDIENELRKYWKVQFTLGGNINVGQELLIQERVMI